MEHSIVFAVGFIKGAIIGLCIYAVYSSFMWLKDKFTDERYKHSFELLGLERLKKEIAGSDIRLMMNRIEDQRVVAIARANVKNIRFSSGKPKMTSYNRLGARVKQPVDSAYRAGTIKSRNDFFFIPFLKNNLIHSEKV